MPFVCYKTHTMLQKPLDSDWVTTDDWSIIPDWHRPGVERDSWADKADVDFFLPSPQVRKKPELWKRLPAALSNVNKAIDKSRELLDLKDDWDEAGSPSINVKVWERAAEFLIRYSELLWKRNATIIDAPSFLPGPNGSIDLHWNNLSYELLINIPNDPSAMAGFYGDDRGEISIKGKFDSLRVNEGLIEWLTK